jgi:uncharacterized protein (DUF1778 family)
MPATITPTSPTESARLSCRLNARVKSRAEEAAALLGQSITAFTEAALAEKSDAVLARVAALQVSERDFRRFLETVGAAPPPTPALAEAMREYDRQAAEEPGNGW